MLSEITNHLPNHPWKAQIQYFDTIESTNTYAKQLAATGAPEGTVIFADHQTGGRGRLGRHFSSPSGMGIYMSVILRPDCHPEELMHLTCATGVSAALAVEKTANIHTGIKWTNDLVLGKRKLGGILTELSVSPQTRKVDWAIVGIGINCCQRESDFPSEIADMAISLGLLPEDRPKLAAALMDELYSMRQNLFAKRSALMDLFRNRCVTIGSDISILRGDSVAHATALRVDDDGGLLVQYSDGTTDTVTSGEVSIRGMYGYV